MFNASWLVVDHQTVHYGLVLPSCLWSVYSWPGSVPLSKNSQQSLVFFFMASYLLTLPRETGQG